MQIYVKDGEIQRWEKMSRRSCGLDITLLLKKYIMTRTTGMKSGAKNGQLLNYEFRI